jgi:hypothetical protein
MKMMYEYNIQDFTWNKEKNTLYGTAWDLIPNDPYKGTDPFPNGREQFTIRNGKTYGFRRFRFVGEEILTVLSEPSEYFFSEDVDMGTAPDRYYQTNWVFKSEDNIKCVVDVGMHY